MSQHPESGVTTDAPQSTPAAEGSPAAPVSSSAEAQLQAAARPLSQFHCERMFFPIGITLLLTIVVVTAAATWWTQHIERDAARQQQVKALFAAGQVLSQAAETMLIAEDYSAARRLLMDFARAYELERCTIQLPNGRIIADADPSRISVDRMPPGQTATHQEPDLPVMELVDQWFSADYPMYVAGRGEATLRISTTLDAAPRGNWTTQAGATAIGSAGLIVLLLAYRRLRSRFEGLSLIREALMALGQGENDKAALQVQTKLCPEAVLLNDLVAQQDRLRQQLMSRQVETALAFGSSGRADIAGICDALRQGIIVIDEQMRVVYANGAAAVYLQTRREALAGTALPQYVSDVALLDAARAALDANGKRSVVEWQRDNDQGHGVLRMAIRPHPQRDQKQAVLVIEDITQQRVAEESRTAFVAHATHELRMPLTNIRLYLETALEDGENDPKLRGQCLNVINQESRRLERLVSDMLSMSEIEAGSLKLQLDDVRLDALFADLENDYQAQAKEKQIALKFDLPPKLPVIQADRDKIVMAMHNMIGNAIKYTPEKGQVTVSVEANDDQLMVEVRDSGIGIPSGELERIFEKFYRAGDKRVEKITGSGLGLTLAREVVRLHGGDITVESEVDKGSAFTLTLPTGTKTS